jgi:hypothetical protein
VNNKVNKLKYSNRSTCLNSALFLLLLFCACQQKNQLQPQRNIAFYYWKSVFDPTEFEKQFLSKLSVKKIYLKFCDVDWNPAAESPQPIAPVRFKFDTKEFQRLANCKIIPVIFITNSCLSKIDTTKIDELAANMSDFVKATGSNNHLTTSGEIQLDCDWTSSTREKYFRLISAFRQKIKLSQPGTDTVSVTIRMHQVKYRHQTGVPPADKGVLMCYNMGNLKNPATKNSIVDVDEMKRYLGDLDQYPLLLDLALPLFEWQVWFRNSAYHGIIHSSDIPALPFQNNQYVFRRDSMLGQYEFKAGDFVRNENSKIETLREAATFLKEKLPASQGRALIFYHLDSLTLRKYNPHELEEVYDRL